MLSCGLCCGTLVTGNLLQFTHYLFAVSVPALLSGPALFQIYFVFPPSLFPVTLLPSSGLFRDVQPKYLNYFVSGFI